MADNFNQLGFKEDKPSDDFKSLGFVAEPSQVPKPSLQAGAGVSSPGIAPLSPFQQRLQGARLRGPSLLEQIQQQGGVAPFLREAGKQAAAIPIGAAQEAGRLVSGIPGSQAGLAGLLGRAVSKGPSFLQRIAQQEPQQAKIGKTLADIGGFTGVAAATGGVGEAAGIPAFLTGLGAQAAGGAAISPGERGKGAALSAVLGLGGKAAELIPRAGIATLRKLGKTAAAGLFEPISNSISGLINKLRHNDTTDNFNSRIFNLAKQNYEETRGLTRKGLKEVPLEDGAYNFRNPADSISSAFTRVNELAKGRIGKFNQRFWKGGIATAQEKIIQELKQFPNDPEALEAQKFLNRVKGTETEPGWRLNSIKDGMTISRKLNEEWNKANSIRPNPIISSLTGILKEGVRDGMSDTASGDSIVRAAFEAANKKFQGEQLPFEEFAGRKTRFIKEYNKPEPRTDKFIEDHVRFDQPEKLNSFLTHLPNQNTRDLVTAHIFQDVANNPEKFIQKYSKFDQQSRRLLFPKDFTRLNNLETLFKNAPNAFRPAEKRVGGIVGKVARGSLGVLGGADILRGNILAGLALGTPLIAREAAVAAGRIPAVQRRLLSSLGRPQIRRSVRGLPANLKNTALAALLSQRGNQQ